MGKTVLAMSVFEYRQTALRKESAPPSQPSAIKRSGRGTFLSCHDIKALITTYLRHLICWYFSAPPFRPLQSLRRTVQQRLWRHGSSVYWFLWFCDVIFYGHSLFASLFVLRRLGTCKVSLAYHTAFLRLPANSDRKKSFSRFGGRKSPLIKFSNCVTARRSRRWEQISLLTVKTS